MPAQREGFLSSKIARRIFALFVLSALFPIAVLTFFSFTQISEKLQEQVNNRLHQRSKAIGFATNQRLLQLEASLGEICARLVDMRRSDPSAALADTPESVRSMFQGLILLDHEAKVIDTLNSSASAIRFDLQDWAHLHAGNTLLFTQAQGESGGRILMARAPQPSAPTCTILVGEVNSAQFWETQTRSYEFELLVFDHLGRVLRNTIPDIDPLIPLREISLEVNMNVTWQGPERTFQAFSWQLFMRPHFHDEWTFLLSQDEAVILGPIQTLRQTFFLVTLLSFLLVTLISSQVIRRAMTPILLLRTTTERVSSGDFDARVEITSDDEFGELGQAFNEMISRLNDYRDECQQNENDLLDACENAVRAAAIESQFLANVSHELRTPITSIRSFAELLREYGDEHVETRQEFLDIIVTEADRLMRLIEDILDFTKISSGNMPMEFQRGHINESLEAVVRNLQPLAIRNGAIIDLEITPELPELWFDHDRIVQVWINLISNAIKFSILPGDKIRISAKVVEHDIVVEVCDEGPGIRAEDQLSIFQRFRQVSTDLLTDKPKGAGLGLTIANDIVSYHEGRIEVESVEGEGATFRVFLPILGRPPMLKGPPPSSESELMLGRVR